MTDQRRLDLHHVDSLDRLMGKRDESERRWIGGHMKALLEDLFPIKTSHGEVGIGEVGWMSWPSFQNDWKQPKKRPKWYRALEFSVSVNDSLFEGDDEDGPQPRASLPLLWPIDETTMRHREHFVYPELRLSRASLIDGRPLVPLSQRSYRPGLHIIRHNSITGRRLVIVPDAGPRLLITPKDVGKSTVYELKFPGMRHRGRPLTARYTTFEESRDLENLSEYFEHFVGRKNPSAAYFSKETAERIRDEIKKKIKKTELSDYVQLLKKLSRDEGGSLPDFDDELSDEVLETRHYGELSARVVLESVLAAVGKFNTLKDDDSSLRPRQDADPDFAKALELAKRINSEYHRRYGHMLSGGKRGGTRYPALVVGADDRNTLGDLEQRRKVTRYSDEIGTETRRWLWTRGIHSTHDRNRLCALQTPESDDIGYVRFLALGDYEGMAADMSEMRDLSAAASLIPFLNHNDPARSSIGSKNLKQAVPIEGAEGPRVRSGTERLIAEAHGVARVPQTIGGTETPMEDAKVTEVHQDRVVAKAGDKEFCVLFGPPGPTGHGVDSRWETTVEVDKGTQAGDIVAHARDIRLEDGQPVLALGADVLVAYTPWHGMNYEDAVVVSESIVDRFASSHILTIQEPCSDEELGHPLVSKDQDVKKGQALARILSLTGHTLRTVVAPEKGEIDSVDTKDPKKVTIRLRTRRPLAVGDKLTNRHGGKCVVSRTVPTDEMPKLPNGRPVEMLLNPIGVIRRLNVGQLLEAHVSLCEDAALLDAGKQYDPEVPPPRPDPLTVGRLYGAEDRQKLANELAEKGAPGGRLPLTYTDDDGKEKELDRHGGVVVGWQYMIKLDHLAADKRNERRRIFVSARNRQPSRGRRWDRGLRRGGSMRTGEMEIWALLATGADEFLKETLAERSSLTRVRNATLDSVKAHLAVGQIGIDKDTSEVRLLDSRATAPLPKKPKDWLQELRSRRARGATPDPEDALYAVELHGSYVHIVSCSCDEGEEETRIGFCCEVCGDFARLRPSPERAEVKYHIELDTPVRHPWFGLRRSETALKKARARRFPEEESLEREKRREAAIQAAKEEGFEATTGLSHLDGSRWLALHPERSLVCTPESAPDGVPIAGIPASGLVDVDIDWCRSRAFLLHPGARGMEVTEIDIAEGKFEFVRNWTAVRSDEAHRAALVTLTECGQPILWGHDVGRFVCVPMLHAVPILPPEYRVFRREVLDERYRDLSLAVLLASTASGGGGGDVSDAVWKILGGRHDEPDAQTISGRLNSKLGMVRRNLRGRHNNGVARSVIAPDTSLRLEEVGLPSVTMKELGLKDGGKDIVLVNRQPTLRPSNIVALRAVRNRLPDADPLDRGRDTNHIALHPLMAKQLAGDFDGDEVTVHCPNSEEAAEQAWDRLRPTAGLLSDADGSAIMEADLDLALGLHLLPQAEGGLGQLKELLGLDDIPARLVELLKTDARAANRILKLADTNFQVRKRLEDLLSELLQERAGDLKADGMLEALKDTERRSRVLDLFVEIVEDILGRDSNPSFETDASIRTIVSAGQQLEPSIRTRATTIYTRSLKTLVKKHGPKRLSVFLEIEFSDVDISEDEKILKKLGEIFKKDLNARHRLCELCNIEVGVQTQLEQLLKELIAEGSSTDSAVHTMSETLSDPDVNSRRWILSVFIGIIMEILADYDESSFKIDAEMRNHMVDVRRRETDILKRMTDLFETVFRQIFDESGTNSRSTIPASLIELLVEDWYKRMAKDMEPDCSGRIRELYELATDVCTGWSASLLELERLNEDQFRALTGGQSAEHPDDANKASWPPWLVEALGAGVAGKPDGLKQLLVKRGTHRTFSGKRHYDVKGCFLDGLSSDDLFKTAPAALTTLAHKKLVTPLAGDLTKRLADAMYGVTVTTADCGVELEIRTPLDCREPTGCCAACIGELASGRTPEENERIGLLAAMLIGERCTQKAMKTFQSGGTNEAVDDTVNELFAAFGERASVGHPSFKEAVAAGQLPHLASRVAKSLDVDERLVCLVLRQLQRFEDEKRPLQAARLTGDPLVDASTLGRLSELLKAIGRDGSRATGLQAEQVYHP